jgi:nitric oxide reductase subunit B
MQTNGAPRDTLSSGWRNAAILILILGFSVLIWLTAKSYRDAPPIPEKVVDPSGTTVFTSADIRAGQQVFLKYGLMENGTIWGHGAYMGPDFSAEYLHTLSQDASEILARARYHTSFDSLGLAECSVIRQEIASLFKRNRYDVKTHILSLTEPEAVSYQRQIVKWTDYFSRPAGNAGLPAKFISEPTELRQLTAFFAWTAWSSVANRPGQPYSFTNNFPYDPTVGNTPSMDSFLWSALSLIPLLAVIAIALFAFGKFDFLGWKSKSEHVHPGMLPGVATESQRATIKYFVVVALLFLAQVLIGGATAHFRADPASFFGFDLSSLFPSNILRTWHLQLTIFWIATAYVAGGLFLAISLGGTEPKGQVKWVNLLFAAILIVAVGSLLGEWLGINRLLEKSWFWLGHQGWEYLDLGRAWQILLALGLVLWLVLIFRAVKSAWSRAQHGQIPSLFVYAALAIPLFYLPAMFFTSTTHYTIVDTWRFWIIHLWVEGFFELFVTVMVATIFYRLDLVSHTTAVRVVYLDAILFLGSGIVGTGHHWYWTGQSTVTMALAACFSAMEVVPLTLLTLGAWDFIRLGRAKCETCGKEVSIPHKWTFYFLIAVGFWNFVGAGIFGFLINLPIVSYFEVGTILTPNHGHAALMGVFGMLALALLVFSYRQVLSDSQWSSVEKLFRLSFWGLNVGLALMVATNLFPGGVIQLVDVLKNGYWHARSSAFLSTGAMHTIEWLRLPADAIFIVLGAVPIVIASIKTYLFVRQSASLSG